MATLRAKDFEPSVPVELKLLAVTSKNVKSRITNEFQGMFSTSRGALYLDAEPAGDVERQVRDLQIAPGDVVRITRIQTSHGGCRWHVARPPELEQQLRDSLTNVERNRNGNGRYMPAAPMSDETHARVFAAPASAPPGPAGPGGHYNGHQNGAPASPPAHDNAAPLSQRALKYMSAYKDAADVLIATKEYIHRQGILVDLRLEDVRCLAATITINEGGGR